MIRRKQILIALSCIASSPLPNPLAYAISTDEKQKYEGLFATYDTDGDGFDLMRQKDIV